MICFSILITTVAAAAIDALRSPIDALVFQLNHMHAVMERDDKPRLLRESELSAAELLLTHLLAEAVNHESAVSATLLHASESLDSMKTKASGSLRQRNEVPSDYKQRLRHGLRLFTKGDFAASMKLFESLRASLPNGSKEREEVDTKMNELSKASLIGEPLREALMSLRDIASSFKAQFNVETFESFMNSAQKRIAFANEQLDANPWGAVEVVRRVQKDQLFLLQVCKHLGLDKKRKVDELVKSMKRITLELSKQESLSSSLINEIRSAANDLDIDQADAKLDQLQKIISTLKPIKGDRFEHYREAREALDKGAAVLVKHVRMAHWVVEAMQASSPEQKRAIQAKALSADHAFDLNPAIRGSRLHRSVKELAQ